MATANPAIGATDQSPAASRENFKGEVLDPSVFNKNWVRLAAVAGVVGLAARGTGYLPERWAVYTHLMSYSINLGMIFWVTFIAGLVMFKNMTRQSFGKVQAKLFPKYFLVSVLTLALQIGTLKFAMPVGLQREQLTSLGIALVASLLNFVIEPMGTAVLMERYALENASGPKDKEKIKSLKGKFGTFHGFSSLLNLVVLIAIFSHGYWLASRLVLA